VSDITAGCGVTRAIPLAPPLRDFTQRETAVGHGAHGRTRQREGTLAKSGEHQLGDSESLLRAPSRNSTDIPQKRPETDRRTAWAPRPRARCNAAGFRTAPAHCPRTTSNALRRLFRLTTPSSSPPPAASQSRGRSRSGGPRCPARTWRRPPRPWRRRSGRRSREAAPPRRARHIRST